jgi:hypothetical protein
LKKIIYLCKTNNGGRKVRVVSPTPVIKGKNTMKNKIESHVIEEGNLRAVKATSDFGGCNMWEFYIKDTTGWFTSVQWMSVGNIQPFFKTKLPVYKQVGNSKYEMVD